ncbi:transmembrane protein 116 isoform X2 [Austrofundulus limnaeus]|uniref:Transmembrane protein 116 isoform X2 n=1 Tax=Austrofundulus limnaeus TaxID=52670 RepID=A0A2I4CCD7_AUSLI|nr:PREDICTED: transmembrane protein 116 isoform X2 [Austrofundulus limnaeus]
MCRLKETSGLFLAPAALRAGTVWVIKPWCWSAGLQGRQLDPAQHGSAQHSGVQLHHPVPAVPETEPETRGQSSDLITGLICSQERPPVSGQRSELQPLFLLSVADLFLAVCWVIGAAIFFQPCGHLNTHCYNLHTVEQILYMASFFYTLNYVWNLFTTTRDKYSSCLSGYSVQFSNRVSTPAKIISLLSFVLPVLLMTPVFIQGNLSYCQANLTEPYRCLLMHTGALYLTSAQQLSSTCRLLHNYQILVFLVTFVLTLLSITVLVVKARRIYRRVVTSSGYLGTEQRASFHLLDRRMVLYPLIFVLCWGPAVSLAFLRVAKPTAGHGRAGVVLYIAQALTSASQGFFNCLVYGWTRVHLRRAGLTVLSREVDSRSPLLQIPQNRIYRTMRTMS